MMRPPVNLNPETSRSPITIGRFPRALRLIVLVSVSSAVLLGCAAPKQKLTGDPRYPSVRYVSAEGTGPTDEKAREDSLLQLRLHFESDALDETLKNIKSLLKLARNEPYEALLETKVQEISSRDIKSARVVKIWKSVGGTNHAMAVLDRLEGRSDWISELGTFDTVLGREFQLLVNTRSNIIRYRIMKRIAGVWLDRSVHVTRIRKLGFKEDYSSPYDMKPVFRQIASLKSDMPIYLDITGAKAGGITRVLAKALKGAGFPITGNQRKAEIVMIGALSVKPLMLQDKGWKFVQVKFSLAVTDPKHGAIALEIDESIRGADTTVESAEAKALETMNRYISKKVVEAVTRDE